MPKRLQLVALAYKGGSDSAPRVVAQAKGDLAERLLQKAKEANVYICEDSDLLVPLQNLPLGREIPKELYTSVAILFGILAKEKSKKNN